MRHRLADMWVYIQRHRKQSVLFVFVCLVGSLFVAAPAYAQIDSTVIFNGILQGVSWMLLKLANIFMGLTVFGLKFFIELARYNNFIDAPPVVIGWVMVRDLANMCFIVVLLVIAFGTILGAENYEWKKLLAKMIFAAIFINFSKLIAQLVVDVAHVFTMTFLNAVSATAGGNLINMFHLQGMLKIVSQNPGATDIRLDLFAASVLALVFSAMAMATMFAYVVVMASRVVVLWVLFVLAPFAYILGVIPAGKSYADEYWQTFTKHVIVAPVMVFFLWLSFATLGNGTIAQQIGLNMSTTQNLASGAVQDSSTVNPSASILEVTTWENMASFILAIAFMAIGLGAVQKLGVKGGDFVGSAVGFAKAVGLVASGYMAGRWLAKNAAVPLAKGAAMNIPLVGGKSWSRRGRAIGHRVNERFQNFQLRRNEFVKDKFGDVNKAFRDNDQNLFLGEITPEQHKKKLEELQAKNPWYKRAGAAVAERALETEGRAEKRVENWQDAAEARKEAKEKDYSLSSTTGGQLKYENRAELEYFEERGKLKAGRRMDQYRRRLIEEGKKAGKPYEEATEEAHHDEHHLEHLEDLQKRGGTVDEGIAQAEAKRVEAEERKKRLDAENLDGFDNTIKVSGEIITKNQEDSKQLRARVGAYLEVQKTEEVLGKLYDAAAELKKSLDDGDIEEDDFKKKDKVVQKKIKDVEKVQEKQIKEWEGHGGTLFTPAAHADDAAALANYDKEIKEKEEKREKARKDKQEILNSRVNAQQDLDAAIIEKAEFEAIKKEGVELPVAIENARKKLKNSKTLVDEANKRANKSIAYNTQKTEEEAHVRSERKERSKKELEQVFLGTAEGHKYHAMADQAEQGKVAAEQFIKTLKSKSLAEEFRKAAEKMKKIIEDGGENMAAALEEAAKENLFIRAQRNSVLAGVEDEEQKYQETIAAEHAQAGFYELPKFGSATPSNANAPLVAKAKKNLTALEAPDGAKTAAMNVASILRRLKDPKTKGSVRQQELATLFAAVNHINDEAWVDDTIGEISALLVDLDKARAAGKDVKNDEKWQNVMSLEDIFVNQLGMIKRDASGKYRSFSNPENAAALQALVATGGNMNMVLAHQKIGREYDKIKNGEKVTGLEGLDKSSSYADVAKKMLNETSMIVDKGGKRLVASYSEFVNSLKQTQEFLQDAGSLFKRAALNAGHIQNGGHQGYDREMEGGIYRLRTTNEAAKAMAGEAAKRKGLEGSQYHSLGTVHNEIGRLIKIDETYWRSVMSAVTSAQKAGGVLSRTTDQVAGYGTGQDKITDKKGRLVLGGGVEGIDEVFGGMENFMDEFLLPAVNGQAEALKFIIAKKAGVADIEANSGVINATIRYKDASGAEHEVGGRTYSEFLSDIMNNYEKMTGKGLTRKDRQAIQDAISVSKQKERDIGMRSGRARAEEDASAEAA